MANHPQIVIDQSIKQLQTLSAILAAQIQGSHSTDTQLPIEKRICKEVLLTVGVLLPKLQEARRVVDAADPVPPQCCTSCED
jgi:hypothetical protein